MSCIELTLLAKNPDTQEDGETKIFIDIDDIITAYRFPWQDMTHVVLANGGQLQVAEESDEVMSYKGE